MSAAHAIDAEVRLYDRLFTVPEPDAEGDFKTFINPQSLEVVTAKCEPSLGEAQPELRYQFERPGLFRARSGFTARTNSFSIAPSPFATPRAKEAKRADCWWIEQSLLDLTIAVVDLRIARRSWPIHPGIPAKFAGQSIYVHTNLLTHMTQRVLPSMKPRPTMGRLRPRNSWPGVRFNQSG